MPSELNLRTVLLGLVLAVVMGAANVYVGLSAGMTVSASIPAAVMAMVVLRGLFGSSNILEANQVQTAASAGESLAAGIIFTMPALVMIGFWTEFDYLTVTLIAFAGGLLGVLLMIPMRRVFIVGNQELPYPEGVACAAVLRAGDTTDSRAAIKGLLSGAGLGALVKILSGWLHAIAHSLEGATWLGARVVYLGGDVSPMLVAVGFIVRLNVAVLIFIGGALAWLIGIPMLEAQPGTPALEQAWTLWSTKIRYVGVGAMVVGGVHSIFAVRSGLAAAISELRGINADPADSDDREDISSSTILAAGSAALCISAWLYWGFTGSIFAAGIATICLIVMSFLFSAVASYIVGLVGNSNSPVSGMTITAVLFTGGVLSVMGFAGMQGMVATLGVAAIVCCVACTSGDVCNDLKTGQLVGAQPRQQQIMQIAGVAIASLVMAPVLTLLHHGTEGGIGGRLLPAPQANLFANLVRGIFGEGELPKELLAVGAVIGIVVLICDSFLKKSGSRFRAHIMPIAVGMYLPFGLGPPILLGGFIAEQIAKRASSPGTDSPHQVNAALERGVLFSSGVIAGESLIGIALACLAVLGLKGPDLGMSSGVSIALTAAAAIGIAFCFYSASRPKAA